MGGILADEAGIDPTRRPASTFGGARLGRRGTAGPGPTLPIVRRDWDVLAAIAAGGALGALGRFGVARLVPHGDPADLPVATLAVNLVGCLLIGVLMWLVLEVWGERRYARPFLGVGVLGGFTTFSAFAVEVRDMLAAQAWAVAAAYVVASIVLGLLAVRVGYLAGARATARSR